MKRSEIVTGKTYFVIEQFYQKAIVTGPSVKSAYENSYSFPVTYPDAPPDKQAGNIKSRYFVREWSAQDDEQEQKRRDERRRRQERKEEAEAFQNEFVNAGFDVSVHARHDDCFVLTIKGDDTFNRIVDLLMQKNKEVV